MGVSEGVASPGFTLLKDGNYEEALALQPTPFYSTACVEA